MLSLLAALLSTGQVEDAIALPLVRVAAETMTVKGLDLLQIAATGKIHATCMMTCRHIGRALLKFHCVVARFSPGCLQALPSAQGRDTVRHLRHSPAQHEA